MKVLYAAKNFQGKSKGGEVEIKNERELADQLRSEGYILTSFEEVKEKSKNTVEIKFLDRFLGISLKEKLMFTRNLGVMVASGVPLSRAVKNISFQTRNKRFSKVLEDIFNDIQAGKTFSEGLAKYPAVFSELFVNMTRVGESSGNLEETLDILAVQLEKEHDIISKVKGAMVYPAVILAVMLIIGIIMLTYILPKLMGVFKDMEVELPWTTQLVIDISDFLRGHPFLFSFGFIIILVFFKFFLSTDLGKKTLGFISIHFPLIKNLIIKVNCARFARIYSSLLKSGVSVVEALKIISNTLTNFYYKNAIANGADQVQKGIPLSKIIAEHDYIFPVLVTQMIEVGEETGRTESVLLKLAEFYEGEVSQITKNMSSIIEPILMVIIGAAVGFFAVSMLQPMYSLMENIK